MKDSVTIKTRLNKNDKNPKVTNVIYDWTGCTLEDVKGQVIDSLNIVVQGQFRRAKDIPQTKNVLVKEFVAQMGSRRAVPLTVDGIAAVSQAFKPEEIGALILKLQNAQREAQKQAKKAA